MLALREVQQRPSEDEMEFYIRLKDASNRCRNVHSMEEQMTMFIEGLDASIKPMVSQYRQDSRDVYFLRLVNYAKAHGSAGSSRERKTKKVTIKAPASLRTGANRKVGHPSRKIRGVAHLAEPISGSEGQSYPSRERTGYGNAFIAEGDFIGKSDENGYGEDGSGGTCRRARIRKVRIRRSRIPC